MSVSRLINCTGGKVMGKFFVDGEETAGPEDWRKGLADPVRHWRTGHSAKALAHSWETANGFPKEVREVFRDAQFGNVELLMAFPEYQTPLPGGSRPSQTDLFVLAEDAGDLIVVGVEGKVRENFGDMVEKWLEGVSTESGKPERLQFLKETLGIGYLDDQELYHIRYQLLHRTAAALIEAERFDARCAVMLVHSFSQENEHFGDYRDFLKLLGVSGRVNSVTCAGNKGGIDLYLAWVRGDARFLRV